MMDDEELSHDARSLLSQARAGDDPSPADRARVRQAILATVAGGAGLAASTAASSAAASTSAATGFSLGAKIFAAVLVAGVVGGGVVAIAPWEEPASQPEPHAAHQAVAHRAVAHRAVAHQAVARQAVVEQPPREAREVQVEAPAPVIEAPPVEAPPAIEAPRPRVVRPAPEPEPAAPEPSSTMGDEIRELGIAMGTRDPALALQRLRDHERRYPNSRMSEEREAARVVATCRAGRRDEARALADRFLREHPMSPQATRVRTACE
jgi:hypothetical protein